MLSRHRVSRAAIELIKRFEGYRQKAAQLPDGRWMIGYGHTLTAREGAEVSEADAEALLVYDLIAVQHAVNEGLFAPLGQNEFDALCSFAFNIGLDNFRRSQVLKRLNAGAAVQAACAMELWRKAEFEGERIVVDALVRRRAAEKALFLTPDDGNWTPAPSPVLRPAIDLDGLDLVPLRRPVEVTTEFEGDAVKVRREAEAEAEGLAPDLAPPPVPAVVMAAEAVAARLETLFQDSGAEPDLTAEASADLEVEAPAILPEEPPALEELRPQADFAPPITTEPAALEPEPEPTTQPEPEPEPAFEPEPEIALEPALEAAFGPAAGAEEELAIPATPQGLPDHLAARVEVDEGPFDFIPARRRPAPAPREPSVIWDLLLALFGLAFFGFGVFWGLEASPATVGGFPMPLFVAWSAGLAGVGFVVVAIYRLLQRLGREAEAD
ncbi:MAG: lysozyme [Caulobacterales bacterium]|nr:lysozyme [Caulobacterales bacterium]